MPESKGRSGKKPKYQIADIGGTDLTSEDISTERVLNFLIKGEIGSIGESGLPGSGGAPTSPSAARPESALLPETSEYSDSSEHLVKKSLSHLFERAGGGAGSARDASIPPSEFEPSSVPSPSDPIADQLLVTETVSDFGPSDTRRSLEVSSAEQPSVSSNSRTSFVPSETANAPERGSTAISIPAPSAVTPWEFPTDFADQVDRWKTLYRLNSGEIAALKTLFLLAGSDESSACYVKMRKLAEMSNLDYRYCQKVVRSLERLGWITKLHDYDASTQMGVLYRVNSRPLHLT